MAPAAPFLQETVANVFRKPLFHRRTLSRSSSKSQPGSTVSSRAGSPEPPAGLSVLQKSARAATLENQPVVPASVVGTKQEVSCAGATVSENDTLQEAVLPSENFHSNICTRLEAIAEHSISDLNLSTRALRNHESTNLGLSAHAELAMAPDPELPGAYEGFTVPIFSETRPHISSDIPIPATTPQLPVAVSVSPFRGSIPPSRQSIHSDFLDSPADKLAVVTPPQTARQPSIDPIISSSVNNHGASSDSRERPGQRASPDSQKTKTKRVKQAGTPSALRLGNHTIEPVRLGKDCIEPVGIPLPSTYAEATNLALLFPEIADKILRLPLRKCSDDLSSSSIQTPVVGRKAIPEKQDRSNGPTHTAERPNWALAPNSLKLQEERRDLTERKPPKRRRRGRNTQRDHNVANVTNDAGAGRVQATKQEASPQKTNQSIQVILAKDFVIGNVPGPGLEKAQTSSERPATVPCLKSGPPSVSDRMENEDSPHDVSSSVPPIQSGTAPSPLEVAALLRQAGLFSNDQPPAIGPSLLDLDLQSLSSSASTATTTVTARGLTANMTSKSVSPLPQSETSSIATESLVPFGRSVRAIASRTDLRPRGPPSSGAEYAGFQRRLRTQRSAVFERTPSEWSIHKSLTETVRSPTESPSSITLPPVSESVASSHSRSASMMSVLERRTRLTTSSSQTPAPVVTATPQPAKMDKKLDNANDSPLPREERSRSLLGAISRGKTIRRPSSSPEKASIDTLQTPIQDQVPGYPSRDMLDNQESASRGGWITDIKGLRRKQSFISKDNNASPASINDSWRARKGSPSQSTPSPQLKYSGSRLFGRKVSFQNIRSNTNTQDPKPSS